MAIQFTREVLFSLGSAILTTPPISMFARIDPDSAGTDNTVIVISRSLSQGFADFELFSLEIRGSGNDNTVRASQVGPAGSSSLATTANGTVTFNAWNTVGGVFASLSSRTAYCNGVAGTEDTTAVTNPTVGATYVGARVPAPGHDFFRPFSGCMQDAAIWNAALTAGDMLALHKGWSPLQVQRNSLVFYQPFFNIQTETVNLVGTATTKLTGFPTGSTAACPIGPGLILPAGFKTGKGSIAPAPSRKLYFIERMDNRLWPQIEDAWCLDSALALPQSEPDATLQVSSATGDGTIRSYSIINGGSGYTSPIGQIEDAEGDGTGATVSFGLTSGVITTATATAIGSDYIRPILTVLDTTGTGAAVLPILTNYTTMSASAAVFDSGNVGDIVRVGAGKLEVVAVTDPLTATGNVIMPILAVTPNDPDDTPLPATSGNWTMTTPTTTVSGLWHLEGVTVSALADGGVVGNLTVADGSVTLPVEASAIVAGLPFTAQLQTLYVEAQGGGTIQSRRKDIFQVVVRVENSRAPTVGVNQPDAAAQPGGFNVPWTGLAQIKERSVNVPPGQPVPLYSGDYDPTNVDGTWDTRGQVAVEQRNPVPLTVTALVPQIKVGDTPS